MNRQKSVPLPKRTATRNSSTSDEISQPARFIQASTPRAMTRLTPIVTSGTNASKSERYTASSTSKSRTTVASAARSSDFWTLSM